MASIKLTNNSETEKFSLTTHGGGRIFIDPLSTVVIDIEPLRYSASFDFLKGYYDRFSDNLTIEYEGMTSDVGISEAAADLKYASKEDVYTKQEADEKFVEK